MTICKRKSFEGFAHVRNFVQAGNRCSVSPSVKSFGLFMFEDTQFFDELMPTRN